MSMNTHKKFIHLERRNGEDVLAIGRKSFTFTTVFWAIWCSWVSFDLVGLILSYVVDSLVPVYMALLYQSLTLMLLMSLVITGDILVKMELVSKESDHES